MYCSRYSCTISSAKCLDRQKKAQSQSDTAIAYTESLIFCCKCEQGIKISKNNGKILDLDISKLKRDAIKDLIKRKDFTMFKIKRVKLKRKPKRIQLKRRA